ncbi:MAG: hypothetical protein JXB07_01285 [Anaerolineae bacterium]|nr:hypothetical protein [Anaerolineae bacterium]
MTTRFHGITSLALAGAAIALGAVAMFQSAMWIGVGYLLVCAIAAPVVLYAYCAKCPCKTHCAHVLPGKAAMLFKRQPGPYSPAEMLAMIVALLLMVGLPQIVLWRSPGLLIAFWVLLGIAVIQVRSVVCRACGNINCPLNKVKQPA